MSAEGRAVQWPHSRFEALDSWRGIAAVTVALYHLFGTGFITDSAFIRNGYTLVDFFFVLSGFVIAGAYGGRLVGGFSLARFMLLRVGRIWPLHVVMLIVFVAYEALVWKSHGVPLFHDGVLLDHGTPGALFLSIVLMQAYWVPDLAHWAGRAWNGPSWSISIELMLYVTAGLAIRRPPVLFDRAAGFDRRDLRRGAFRLSMAISRLPDVTGNCRLRLRHRCLAAMARILWNADRWPHAQRRDRH